MRVGFLSSTLLTVIVLAAGTFYFQNFLVTRVIGPSSQPVRIPLQEEIVVGFETSPRVPAVRIELCPEVESTGSNCVLLAREAKGSAATLFLPFTYPAGKAVLKVTNYSDVEQAIIDGVQYHQAVIIADK